MFFYWDSFPKKMISRIESPRHAGAFLKEEAELHQMRLSVGEQREEALVVTLYWLVDEEDGVIADARFQAYGPPALTAAADAACELLIRKNYDQAARLTADLIDRQVRDNSAEPAFPASCFFMLDMVIAAIESACAVCTDIPLSDGYITPPMQGLDLQEANYAEWPGWQTLTTEQKIGVIREVIEKEIQPYIELDAGGVEVLDLIGQREVWIAYSGSCTTCYSATGTTLSAIQQILRAKVCRDLIVTPKLEHVQRPS